MTASIPFLFVYGSLRKGFPSPVYHYISDHFHFVSMGTVQGTLFDLGPYPAAVPTRDGHEIIGELYQLRTPAEFGWAIGQLDDYEGVTVEEGEQQLYRRELAEIRLENGTIQPAWIYWYNGDVLDKPVVESGDIMQYVQDKLNS